jgi:hypothetical protein
MAAPQRSAKAVHWQQVLEQFQQSGLSVRAFCAERCIAANSFYQWRRKLGDKSNSSGNAIIPVKLVSASPATATIPCRVIQIITPNGFSIRVDSAMPSDELTAILRVIHDSAVRGESC